MSRSRSRRGGFGAIGILAVTTMAACSPPDPVPCRHMVYIDIQFATEPPAELRVETSGEPIGDGVFQASDWNEDGDDLLETAAVYPMEDWPTPPEEITISVFELPDEVLRGEVTVQPDYYSSGSGAPCGDVFGADISVDMP